VLSQLSQTLRAAAVSEEGRELLARGRFTTPLETEGFEVFGALPASRPAKARQQARTHKANEELRQARERLRELEQKAKAAEQDAARLRGELTKSERFTESAREAVAAAQRELKEAQRRARN
jgi:chromosome segregation ATPase